MELKFLAVGCGDGIVIHFWGNDDRYHNIIIDGGTEKGRVYENTLRQEIRQIIDRKEIIEIQKFVSTFALSLKEEKFS